MLFNEPKLLKSSRIFKRRNALPSFSALQRAEIAEIQKHHVVVIQRRCFSALQRAEIAEMGAPEPQDSRGGRFSALQRAEIAEIGPEREPDDHQRHVSVLFNEPKLLKSRPPLPSSPVF